MNHVMRQAGPSILFPIAALILQTGSGLAGQPVTPVDPAQAESEAARRREEAALLSPRGVGEPIEFEPDAVETAEPAIPGLTRGVDWLQGLASVELDLPQPKVLAEHTFLTGRRGRVVPGPYETFIFLPAEEGRRPGERAMLLLPNRLTQRLVSAIGHMPAAEISLAGEVFVYHGRNYVLPSAFRVVTADEATPPPAPPAPPVAASEPLSGDEPPSEPAASAEPLPAAQPDDDVAALISELRSRLGGDRPQADATAEEAEPARDPADDPRARVSLTAEGELLPLQRGRIDRLSDGTSVFVVDNDGDEAGAAKPGYKLLPCLTLMRIEAVAEREGDLRAVRLSGRTTVYRGENYLMPILFTLERTQDVRPLQ